MQAANRALSASSPASVGERTYQRVSARAGTMLGFLPRR
jgi:hypothetical protein